MPERQPTEIKTFDFQLKEVDPGDAKGEFTGFAAVYGNKDHQGDIIEAGAFTRTLNSLDSEIPLLWQHDVTRPIGIGKLEDHSKGLKIHGYLNLGVKVAQEAYELMKPRAGFKRGIIRGLSIGYDVVKDAIEEGVRKLKEIKLWEVSLVTFPANGRALISDVKSAQLLDNRISMLSAEIEELKARLVMDGLIDPDDVHSIGVPDLACGDEENNPEDLHLFSDLADQMKAFHLLRRMQT